MIIFDCDGVLVDTEQISNRVLAQTITESGYPMTTQDAIARFKGGRIKSLPPVIEELIGQPLPSDWLDQFFARQHAALAQEVEAIPGIADVLDKADLAGRGYCVASQASIDKMKLTLGRTGLWHRFDGRVYSADMVARPKPAPDLFQFAANQQGWRYQDVTVVEDSATGVAAGAAAGMRVIGFTRDSDPVALMKAGATLTVDTMAEVAEALALE